MKHALLLGISIVCITPLAHAETQQALTCSAKDTLSIEQSSKAYINKYSVIPSKQVSITEMQCKDNYAKAKIHPTNPVTDDALIYLHKIKNKWNVMTLGTGIDNDLLKKLPKELRN